MLYLCTRFKELSNTAKDESKSNRAFSSAGLEHLPYKQRVGGSNPSTPTPISGQVLILVRFFCVYTSSLIGFMSVLNGISVTLQEL